LSPERPVDRIADPWGTRTPYAPGDSWPVRVDTFLEPGLSADDVDAWVQSASILHSNGDALDIAVKDGRIVGVRGRAADRVNRGRLGPKDLFGWQANNARDRLTLPLVRRDGRLEPSSWDVAMEKVVDRSKSILGEKGPSAIAFYTTGQLFLEEYYTLALIARAGLGTNHLDGNTRLCTATADESLKQTFGCDGQPGSYADVDHADVIVLYGHNAAETQTVLWQRILDRRRGSEPPRLVAIDPRPTPVALEADLHVPIKPGTNVAFLNAVIRELIGSDSVDRAYVDAHTVGFEELEKRTRACTPEWAASICGVPSDQIRETARLLAGAQRLLSTVLQGVYQSNQATAAACQVNNIHLLLGMLGKAGAGVLQMNGQPSAQNTRECGANGDLAGFRNWQNDEHVAELAQIWNVEPNAIPHYTSPTHAMQIFRYCEQGSIDFLWITGTNPAVSLPELSRIRSILARDDLFVVVQDIFPTETTEFADVVLPAATCGEKLGTFTNADRTVHISEKAVEPPGEARSDLDILLDYARRMNFTDRDGAPLVKWNDSESAFEAWKQCSRGRPCDYTGITYERLRGASGIQWPCTEASPDGTERLYGDGRFPADPDYCEEYGKDFLTGALLEDTEYRAMNPRGKAMLKAAEYLPPSEAASDEYPLLLTTGRALYHFHTRTKTARSPQLQAAAPEVWVELSEDDADALAIRDGDTVEVVSPRGRVVAPARLTHIRPGVVFIPFHYGYWDAQQTGEHVRAANELTITEWDPASKQPIFKTAMVRVGKLRDAAGSRPEAGAAYPPAPPRSGAAESSALERLESEIP
jgi:anaerobic selenocysteine-containing dehydrogenase